MKKHIKSYSEINESIGRGSVILIKGKPENGKKKLYAAHVAGHSALPHGGVMLFLSDEFYRIKEEDGKLKGVKISYRSEDSLKSALNLKSPGKISIVKNNNKTPFHWKTSKHTSVISALREIENEIEKDGYLFESIDPEQEERGRMWDEFSNLVLTKTINTAFLGEKQIDMLSYRLDNDRVNDQIWDSGDDRMTIEWSLDFVVMLRSPQFRPYLEYFEIDERLVEVSFFFKSDISMNVSHDSGDYWTPPSTDVDIGNVSTELEEVFVDGASIDSEESQQLRSKVNEIVYDGDMLPDQLEEFILTKLTNQILMKKEN